MRLKILFYFVFLNHLSISWCDDKNGMEMEEKLDFGKAVIENFQKNLPSAIKHSLNKNEFTNIDIKSRHFKTVNDISNHKVDNDEALTLFNSNYLNSLDQDPDFVSYIKPLISKEGNLTLNFLGQEIIKYLNSTLVINSTLRNISENYVANIDAYFNLTCKEPLLYEIDRELYILDFIEVSNLYFSKGANLLFKYIIAQLNTNVGDVKTISEKIKDIVINEKQENLNHICSKLRICRPYPAYSDHVAELLSEILKLPDQKLRIILILLEQIVEKKAAFFKTIMKDNIAHKIGIKLKNLSQNIVNARRFFTVLRRVITRRYLIYSGKDPEIKARIKAVRILIDMIDKAFDMLNNQYLDIAFSTYIKGFQAWEINEPNNMQVSLIDFCDDLENVLMINWNIESKKEAKVLIEMIATGFSYDTLLGRLLSKGSKMLKG